MFKTLFFIFLICLITFMAGTSAGFAAALKTNEINFKPSDGPAKNIRIARITGSNPAPLGDTGGRPLKEFTIVVDDLTIEIVPNVYVDTWAFGFEDKKASVPGPEIRVQEGDFIRVYFKNTHAEPHTIHFHGLNAPFHSDGVPGLSQNEVNTNEVFIYEFVARRPGTHVYHCHFQTLTHLDMGMYGAFIVEAENEIYSVDRELVWIFDEWSVLEEGQKWYDLPMAGFSGQYNYFTINSVAWPKLDSAITGVKEGDKIRVRMINMGYANHSMHIHGHKTRVTHFDGYPVKDPYFIDTIPISPGQRIDFIFEADNPGIFPAHCHVVPHVSNNGDYPGGLLTGIVYEGFELGKLPETVEKYRKRHFSTVPTTPTHVMTEPTKSVKGGDCQKILLNLCNTCHDLGRVCRKIGKKDRMGWSRNVKRMAKKSARTSKFKQVIISQEEQNTLVDCLINQEEDVQAVCK